MLNLRAPTAVVTLCLIGVQGVAAQVEPDPDAGDLEHAEGSDQLAPPPQPEPAEHDWDELPNPESMTPNPTAGGPRMGAPGRPRLPVLYADNMTASFPPGPYTCLYVDPFDPERLAIGTTTGIAAWSEDGAQTVRDARVISPRRMDPLALRGQNSSRRDLAGGAPARRATRLFLHSMREGLPWARWAFWMAVEDPVTELSAITMPGEAGRMLAAGAGGVWLSDRGRYSWTRTFGQRGMPEERETSLLSVTIDPEDQTHMFAGTTSGLLESTDGGFSFHPHPDARLADERIYEFVWDTYGPGLLLAIAAGTVLQSADAGATFEVGYATSNAVMGVSLRPAGGAYVATSGGLVFIDEAGDEHRLLRGMSLVGVAPWGEGAVVATQTELFYVSESEERVRLARTVPEEPFISLQGGEDLAWAATRRGVYRVSSERLVRVRAPDPPRLLMTLHEVDEALRDHLRFGRPVDTRLHDRWYAKLVPRIVAEVEGTESRASQIMRDGTFPVSYRLGSGNGEMQVNFSVFAMWDLSKILVGENHVTNPNFLIERSIREGQERILDEVYWRYREAATLVEWLQRPSADVSQHLAWRTRLEEHAAYLEAVVGQQVVRGAEP